MQGKVNLEELITEQRNSRSMNLDLLSPYEIAKLMNEEDQYVLNAVESVLPEIARVIEWAIDAIASGGRLIYVGAGTSGRIGLLDAVECPPTFGVDHKTVIGLIAGGSNAFLKAVEGAEDRSDLGKSDLMSLQLTCKDVVIGIASSGRTPYVIGALDYGNEIGCHTVSIACNPDSQIGKHAEVSIEAVCGPEILTGSTRLKSGTAQKMICNMISTATMVGLGKVYENLMVDVQQSNLKLVSRAENIVMSVVKKDLPTVQNALKQCHGSVKQAIVMLLAGCTPEIAADCLSKSSGKVREALSSITTDDRQTDTPFWLGMDGGATTTVALVADENGNILHRITGGPLNGNDGLRTKIVGTLLAIFRQLRQMGYAPQQCLGVGLGVAGHSNPDNTGTITAEFRKAGFHCALELWGDQETALAANFGRDKPGILLIAGTGSICIGQDAEGRIHRAGGFGSVIDDAGSAYAIARDAMNDILRGEDGRGPKTRLKDDVLGALHLTSAVELIPFVYDPCRTKDEIAALAQTVSQSAECGDACAVKILNRASEQLALLVEAVAHQLHGVTEIVFSGSVLCKNARIRDGVETLLAEKLPGVICRVADREAAEGALFLIRSRSEVHGSER